MSRNGLPTREWWANKGMVSAMTRAAKHIAAGDTQAAINCLKQAVKTAQEWVDGKHSKIDRAA